MIKIDHFKSEVGIVCWEVSLLSDRSYSLKQICYTADIFIIITTSFSFIIRNSFGDATDYFSNVCC